MAIPSTLRVPGAYIQIEAGQTLFSETYRGLIIAGKTTAGTATPNVPVLVSSAQRAKNLFGAGSSAARSVEAWLLNNPYNELWVLPLADHGSGVAATATAAVTGTATKAGSVPFYVTGKKVPVAVSVGDTASTIAAAFQTAVAADVDLPATATVSTGTVTLTAKNKGALGNDLDLRVGLYSAYGEEELPAGISVAVSNFAGGSNNPDLALALANLSDEPFRFIVSAYTDETSLSAIVAEVVHRWDPLVQEYGHVLAAISGSTSELQTVGEGQNSQYLTLFGTYDSPTAPEVIASAASAVVAKSITEHPAQPFTGLEVLGVVAPPANSRFTTMEKDALYHAGITPLLFQGSNTTRLSRVITTYQKNAWDQNDASWLDLTTAASAAFVGDYIRTMLGKFTRHLAASEKAVVQPLQKVLKPSTLKGEVIGALEDLELMGIVENAEGTVVTVTRNILEPTRYDITLAPDLTNPLYIFGATISFVLQTREAA